MLQPLEIPNIELGGIVVSMDSIFGLTPSTHAYYAIFVCVDKLSKMALFTPTTTHVIVEGTTRLFRDHLYTLHSVPKVF